MKHIVFTGGGTGGHVFPAIAVYSALPEAARRRVVWVGSRSGVERSIVAEHGIPYHPISSGKLRRYFDLKNVTDAFRVIAGIIQAVALFRRLDVSVVFSKGGFVAVPVVIAARLRRVPVVIHESDADPGLATRISARFAEVICAPYNDTFDRLPPNLRGRVRVTGNPVRPAFFSVDESGVLAELDIDDLPELPVLFVTGGSLGAMQLNEWVAEAVEALTHRAVVIHQTGETGAAMIPEIAGRALPRRYYGAVSFGELFPRILRRADLVVARAGAGTIAEIAVTATPAVLVPLSRGASRGDQIRNAHRYAATGAALVLDDPEITADEIGEVVHSLLADERRRREMAANAGGWSTVDAGTRIAEIIVDIGVHHDGAL